MKYSEIGLNVLAAKECGIIKTNAQFQKEFSNRSYFENLIASNNEIKQMKRRLLNDMEDSSSIDGMVCIYDDEFPVINDMVKNNSEKPYLLFYKGDISLLSDLNKNVAVIGTVNPEKEIIERETEVVKGLVDSKMVIVSGLALGCDTIAHQICLDLNGSTIAILSTPVNEIYPAQNRGLANDIISKGGLLLSEYYKEANSGREAISRLVERDRLQAMFAKAIILIASYRKNEGDSGSRHAMEAARKYEIERYVMYNQKIDEDNPQFALNKDLLNQNYKNKAKILHNSSIKDKKNTDNIYLEKEYKRKNNKQMSLL